MQTIQNTIVGTLENVKEKLEKRDQAVIGRDKIFSSDEAPQNEPVIASDEVVPAEGAQMRDFNEFKKVSFELMDIGMYYGQQGVDRVKMLPLYQKVDRVVQFDDKFDLVKTHGFQLYTYLDQTFTPLLQKVVFLYDTTTQTVSTYIQVITTRHQEIQDYVNKTYS